MKSPDGRNGLHVQNLEYFRQSDHLPEAIQPQATPFIAGVADNDFLRHGKSEVSQKIQRQRRNPFGLSPLAFGALIALSTALIVGAAVGGGLGAVLDGKENCKSSLSSVTSTSNPKTTKTVTETPTPTISTPLVNYVAPQPSSIQSLYIDCPALENTILLDLSGHQYRVSCGTRIVGGTDIATLSALTAYSFEDCIQACSLMTQFDPGSNCSAVSWDHEMAWSYSVNIGANCWLFNSTSTISLNNNVTTAILQQ